MTIDEAISHALEVAGEQQERADMLNIPTADVQPIKHGRWIYVGSVRSWDEIKCSACNSAFSTEDRDLILNWDFCPHCGARMDLKDGDTNG